MFGLMFNSKIEAKSIQADLMIRERKSQNSFIALLQIHFNCFYDDCSTILEENSGISYPNEQQSPVPKKFGRVSIPTNAHNFLLKILTKSAMKNFEY